MTNNTAATARIAELEALIARGSEQLRRARALRLASLVTSLRRDLRRWRDELAELSA